MLLPIHRFVQYYEYNLSRAKRRAPFQPSFRALTWRAWCFRNEVSSPDAICFAPKGRGRFPGFKKKSFKLSRLLSFFAQEGSISLTLTVRSSLLVVKGCVHEVFCLSETGYWRPDSVVRHPALLSLTVHSGLFSHKIVGIKHVPLHTIILVSNVLSLAWVLVPRGLPCSVHLKLILRPVMVSAGS